METQGLDAVKSNKVLPTVAGLADCKDFGKAANLMFGITNPSYFDISEYYGYNIRQLKSAARFLQITINRNGISNGVCPLLFLGKTASFKELPLPNDTANMNAVYKMLEDLKNQPSVSNKSNSLFFSFSKNYNNKFGCKGIIKYLCSLFNKHK